MRRFSVFIVGSKHHGGAEERLALLEDGAMVQLQREPANPHDTNAIIVRHRQLSLGYLPAKDAADIAPIMDERGLSQMMCRLDKPPDGRPPSVSIRFVDHREERHDGAPNRGSRTGRRS